LFITTKSLTFTIGFLGVTNAAMSVDALARGIMSDASIDKKTGQTAIGFACQRNSNHASNQRSTAAAVTELAKNIFVGKVNNPTKKVNDRYSPYSMPKKIIAHNARDLLVKVL